MVHIINSIGTGYRTGKKQLLSCINGAKKTFCPKDIYDAVAVQQRINDAAKVSERLDAEVKKRYEDIKHINLLG